MKIRVIILMLICLSSTGHVFAQWTEKDSIWLQDVLSGKEKVKLNPETMKAIESGTLIGTDEPGSEMIMAPARSAGSSIQKDFSEYIRTKEMEQDTEYNPNRKVALKDLPPAVFMRHKVSNPPRVKMLGSFYVSQNIKNEGRKPSGISFNDLLKQTFMPSERAKRRNAQRWQTYKYYNNYP